MSSVSFYPIESQDSCGICWDSMQNKPAVEHKGTCSNPKQFHLSCIKDWISRHAYCPSCKKPAEKSSLFTWKERALQHLKFSVQEALGGVVDSGIANFFCSVGNVFHAIHTPQTYDVNHPFMKFLDCFIITPAYLAIDETCGPARPLQGKMKIGAIALTLSLLHLVSDSGISAVAKAALFGAVAGVLCAAGKRVVPDTSFTRFLAKYGASVVAKVPIPLQFQMLNQGLGLSQVIVQTSVARAVLAGLTR